MNRFKKLFFNGFKNLPISDIVNHDGNKNQLYLVWEIWVSAFIKEAEKIDPLHWNHYSFFRIVFPLSEQNIPLRIIDRPCLMSVCVSHSFELIAWRVEIRFLNSTSWQEFSQLVGPTDRSVIDANQSAVIGHGAYKQSARKAFVSTGLGMPLDACAQSFFCRCTLRPPAITLGVASRRVIVIHRVYAVSVSVLVWLYNTFVYLSFLYLFYSSIL